MKYKPFFTKGGVKVPHRKELASKKTVKMEEENELVFPVLQHIGVPCDVLVKKGDKVKVGDVIADSEKLFSAPIHSSVSGIVSKVDKIFMPNGDKIDAIYITSDKKRELSEKLHAHTINTKDELIKAVRESGLVGLGGAGFPTHVKLNIPDDKKIDTLLINAAECEPYITSDNRAAIEDIDDIIYGILLVKKILKIENAIIAIEDNKPNAIEVLNEATKNYNDINVVKLKSKYPQGAEKVLIKASINKKLPIGKIPLDIGVIVMNISSIAFLSQYMKTGIPLIYKRITVAGLAINEPKNVKVLIGTPIKDVIDFCKGYKGTPCKMLMGGPMMGIALQDDNFPILKQNNAILALSEKETIYNTPTDCIRCGKCIDVCPMGLMPTLLESNIENQDIDELKKLSIMNCMECGSCAYICPAKRSLVQSIRLGKDILKNSKMKGDK